MNDGHFRKVEMAHIEGERERERCAMSEEVRLLAAILANCRASVPNLRQKIK